jgi:hypothetical protein
MVFPFPEHSGVSASILAPGTGGPGFPAAGAALLLQCPGTFGCSSERYGEGIFSGLHIISGGRSSKRHQGVPNGFKEAAISCSPKKRRATARYVELIDFKPELWFIILSGKSDARSLPGSF